VTELITYIKTKPGGVNYGSSGVGGAAHLAGEMFKTAAGVQLTHIPYKGAAPAMADLLGGQVPMVFDPIPTSLPHVRGGRIKALAITSAQRSPLVPEVPTVAESGLPGFEVAAWFGLYAPAATPSDIVGKLNADVNRVLQLPEVKEKFSALGADSAPMTVDQFALHLRAEIAKFAKAIKDSGAKAE
jgi:tripartite-type tricarboxylate transporter receptor subunit TctC